MGLSDDTVFAYRVRAKEYFWLVCKAKFEPARFTVVDSWLELTVLFKVIKLSHLWNSLVLEQRVFKFLI